MHTWKLCALAIAVSPCLAQAQDAAKAKTYPHRLTGEELTAHFKETWSANGFTGRQTPITLFSDSGGTVRIRGHNIARAPDGFGTRKLDLDKNQVCFEMTTTSWRAATNCYRVEETEPKAFALRPVQKGGIRFDYKR